MRRLLIAMGLTASGPAFAEHPISKFDSRTPDLEMASKRTLNDIERCLIDAEDWPAPNVYRQPDRPNEVTLIWPNQWPFTYARVDLTRGPDGGTKVRSWKMAKQARNCAS